MGYVVSGFCFNSGDDEADADQAAAAVLRWGFWPSDNSVIASVEAETIFPDVAVLQVEAPGFVFQTFRVYSCDMQGPWPNPHRLTLEQAGGLASLTLVLFASAFAVRAVRRAR